MHTFTSLLFLSTVLFPLNTFAGVHPNLGQRQSSASNGSSINPLDVLNKAIEAMGGANVFQNIRGITFQTDEVYRSTTITQSYSLVNSDVYVSIDGTQNMSYSFTSPNNQLHNFQQRIDRTYAFGEYWIWGFANLQPAVAYSVVVQNHANDSFGFFTNGSNTIIPIPPTTYGYADPGLASVLISDASVMSPLLVWQMIGSNASSAALTDILDGHGTLLPAVYDSNLELTVFFDNTTSLPRFVRRTELNNVFGPSFSDLYFSEWANVPSNADPGKNSSLYLPYRYQNFYNYGNYSEDTKIDNIIVNPAFPANYFAPVASGDSPVQNTNKTAPGPLPGYNYSEVSLFSHAGFWTGPSKTTVSQLNASHPIADLPQLWRLSFSLPNGTSNGGGDYAQLVVEFEDGVLVTDSPAHQSLIILQWVQENLGKPVKYILPTHHHHDHAYGTIDYVRQGATLVIPEVAMQYWSHLPTDQVSFQTYTENKPFIMSDANVQLRAIWHPDAPHAEDWVYMFAAKSCPGANDTTVLYEADAFDNFGDARSRFDFTREWLQTLVSDGVRSDNTLVTAVHGGNTELQNVIDVTGFVYPSLSADTAMIGGPLCVGQ